MHLANGLDSFIILSHSLDGRICKQVDPAQQDCLCWNDMILGWKHQFILNKTGSIKYVDLDV